MLLALVLAVPFNTIHATPSLTGSSHSGIVIATAVAGAALTAAYIQRKAIARTTQKCITDHPVATGMVCRTLCGMAFGEMLLLSTGVSLQQALQINISAFKSIATAAAFAGAVYGGVHLIKNYRDPISVSELPAALF